MVIYHVSKGNRILFERTQGIKNKPFVKTDMLDNYVNNLKANPLKGT